MNDDNEVSDSTEDNSSLDPAPDEGIAPESAEAEAMAGEGAPADESVETPPTEEPPTLEQQLAERTVDLQRLQAEFVNYKRRVERDRVLTEQNAAYKALAPITDVLDSIDRAREHGPLEDGFKAVAEQLERAVTAGGLTKYGAVGEVFDPSLHEALSHLGEDAEVTETTVKIVAKSGYRIGERVVRAAQVLVVDPPSDTGGESTEEPSAE